MSWFDSIQQQAEQALQKAVSKVDSALDIKEDPGSILSPSSGKSKDELLAESKTTAAVTAASAKLADKATRRSSNKDSNSSTTSTTQKKDDDFFGLLSVAKSITSTTNPTPDKKAITATGDASSTVVRSGKKNNGKPADGKRKAGRSKSGGDRSKRQEKAKAAKTPEPSTNEQVLSDVQQSENAPTTPGSSKEKNVSTHADVDGVADSVPVTGQNYSTNPSTNDAVSSTDGTTNDTMVVSTLSDRSSLGPVDDDVNSAVSASNGMIDTNSGRSSSPSTTTALLPDGARTSLQGEADSTSIDTIVTPDYAVGDTIDVAPGTDDSADGGAASVGRLAANESEVKEGAGDNTGATCGDDGGSAASYAEKLAQVTMTLHAREEKILQLTKDLDDKQETHAILHAQIEQLESQLRENHTEQLETLTREFTERLGDVEARLSKVVQERDTLKQQLTTATERFTEKIGQTDKISSEVIAERDAQIEGLLKEGQKLSEKNFKSATINKKLQAKVKEADTTVKSLTEQITSAQARIASLEKDVEEKAAAERKYLQDANQVSAISDKQGKEIHTVRQNLKQMSDKNEGLQAALDKSFKRNADLEKQLAEETSRANNAIAVAESAAKDSKETELKTQVDEFGKEKEVLLTQITDLRTAISRLEAQGARRETNLQQEIRDLNERLQHAEQREQQLTENISQTARPLVRQIDMLRATLADQTSAHEVAEATLSTRLEEAQRALQAAEETERRANERVSELRLKLSSFEDKHAGVRKARMQLQSELDSALQKAEEADMEAHRQTTRAGALQTALDAAKEEWRVARLTLIEAHRSDVAKREATWQTSTADLKQQLHALRTAAPPPSASAATTSTTTPAHPTSSPGAASQHLGMVGDIRVVPSDDDFARATSGSGTSASSAVAVERLHAQMIHKDRELLQVQRQLRDLEKSRNAIADELVDLVSKNETLQARADELPKVQESLATAQQKLDNIMVMYGEKAEEAAELKMDLADFRAMFQTQTQQLLSQIEELQKP